VSSRKTQKPPTTPRGWLVRAFQQNKRFWDKVWRQQASDCWPWMGRCDKDGYGKFSIEGGRNSEGKQVQKHVRAHRLAWELAFGRTVPAGKLILHSCDTPSCCNPAHLEPGSQLQNRKDCVTRKRTATKATHGDWVGAKRARGNAHGMSTLTATLVRHIRQLRKRGMTYQAIGAEVGVDKTTCHSAINRKTWKHIL